MCDVERALTTAHPRSGTPLARGGGRGCRSRLTSTCCSSSHSTHVDRRPPSSWLAARSAARPAAASPRGALTTEPAGKQRPPPPTCLSRAPVGTRPVSFVTLSPSPLWPRRVEVIVVPVTEDDFSPFHTRTRSLLRVNVLYLFAEYTSAFLLLVIHTPRFRRLFFVTAQCNASA